MALRDYADAALVDIRNRSQDDHDASHPSADTHASEQVAGSATRANRANLSTDPKDEWALQLITLHRLQSIMEAIDVDASSVVTIEEINAFTDAKPQDWR